MNQPRNIFDHIHDFIEAKNEQGYRHEYIMYRFSTEFISVNNHIIVSHLQTIIKKIVDIIRMFLIEYKKVTNTMTQNIYIATQLTSSGYSRNTGAIPNEWENIEQILNDKDANIREIFCVMDEFIHKSCHIMSWFLYQKYLDQYWEKLSIYNDEKIKSKIRYVTEILMGYKDINILSDHVKLKQFVKDNIQNKWADKKLPSICHLWTDKADTPRTSKLIYLTEYQRYIKFKNMSNAFCYDWVDDSIFQEHRICKDNNFTDENNPGFLIDNIQLPPLSSRERKWAQTLNPNIVYDKIIPWKGGCCTMIPHKNTVVYNVTLMYEKATRATSYSGHAIMNMELLSLLDPEFNQWCGIYAMCIIATMVPYCHHSSHEILTSISYCGIPYNLIATTSDIIKNILGTVPNIDIDSMFDKIDTFGKEFDDILLEKTNGLLK